MVDSANKVQAKQYHMYCVNFISVLCLYMCLLLLLCVIYIVYPMLRNDLESVLVSGFRGLFLFCILSSLSVMSGFCLFLHLPLCCVYTDLHQLCCYGSSVRLFASSASLHMCSAVVTQSEILHIPLKMDITAWIRSFSRLCGNLSLTIV